MSATLTGTTRDGVAVNGVIQKKAVKMNPYQTIAAYRTDILFLCHCVSPLQKCLVPNTHRNPLSTVLTILQYQLHKYGTEYTWKQYGQTGGY